MQRPINWLFEDRTRNDGHLVAWQWPNIPLWIWIVSAVVGRFVDGGVGTAIHIVGAVALAIWAMLEIGRGVNPFRRMLGGVVLAGMIAGLVFM